MRIKHRAKRLILRSGLPEDAVTGCARVTMVGRCSLLIEGQRGVVEMNSGRIRFATRDGVLCVEGEGLELQELSSDAAIIYGDSICAAAYRPRCVQEGVRR